MMKQRKTNVILSVLMAALTTLTACSAGDEATQGSSGVDNREVRLRMSLDGRGETRGASDMSGGKTVKVWVDEDPTDLTPATENSYTSGANGALTGVAPTADVLYWPASDQLTLYGITPDHMSGGDLTVAADQSSATDEASDLLFSKQTTYVNDGSGVLTMSFRHVMARVCVTLTAGDGIDLTGATVTLHAKRGTTFTYPVSNSDGYTLGSAVTVGADAITISSGTAAIVPPQTFSEGDVLVTVTFADGVPLEYSIPTGGVTSWTSGNQYNYVITVSSNILSATATVTPWGAGTGDAAAVTSLYRPAAEVGMILCSNGDFVAATSGTLPCGHAKVAVVAYYDPLGVAVEDGTAFCGLALALQDCGSSNCNWSDPNNLSNPYLRWCNQTSEACLPRSIDDETTANTTLDGLSCTRALVSHASHVGAHYAAIAANTYQYNSSAARGAHPKNTSDWFLPSTGQWNLMVKSMCADDDDADLTQGCNTKKTASEFNPKIIAAGGTGLRSYYYHTATQRNFQRSGDGCWIYCSSSGNYSRSYKSYSFYVRAVLAF